MKISPNDWAIFFTGVGAACFYLVAIINSFLGLPFYEPLQTAILFTIVQGMFVRGVDK